MKIDPKHMMFAFTLVMVSLALAACAGFDLGDVVKVKTPNEIQQTRGLPRATTLNEAEAEYQAWFEDVQRNGAQWKASIDQGGEIRGLLGQLTLSALDEIGPTLAGVPVAGPALPALTGLAGAVHRRGAAPQGEGGVVQQGAGEGAGVHADCDAQFRH